MQRYSCNSEETSNSLKASFSRWVFKSHLSKFCKLFPVDAQIHLSQISERAIASRARNVKSSGKYCRIRGFASGGADFLRRKVEGTDRKNRRIGQEKSCKHVKTSSGRDPSLRGPVGQRPQDFTTLFERGSLCRVHASSAGDSQRLSAIPVKIVCTRVTEVKAILQR